MPRTYIAFISHAWAYGHKLSDLKELIEKNSAIEIDYSEVTKDEPINSERESYIKSKLKERILSSDVFVVMAGMYTVYSDWMMWEIETAKKNKIPIVAVKPRGADRIPVIVRDNANVIVGWNSNSIVNAIKEEIKKN